MDVACSLSEDFLTGRSYDSPAMSGSFRFGEFELDVAAYALRREGQRIKLEKIPMEVLVLLVQKGGILVSRTEIQAALWGSHVFVDEDAAINTAIRKIRRALGDDAEHPRFVETVVGKGYRFIADRPRHHLPNYLVTRGKRQFVLDRRRTCWDAIRRPLSTSIIRPCLDITRASQSTQRERSSRISRAGTEHFSTDDTLRRRPKFTMARSLDWARSHWHLWCGRLSHRPCQ